MSETVNAPVMQETPVKVNGKEVADAIFSKVKDTAKHAGGAVKDFLGNFGDSTADMAAGCLFAGIGLAMKSKIFKTIGAVYFVSTFLHGLRSVDRREDDAKFKEEVRQFMDRHSTEKPDGFNAANNE